MHRGAYGFAAIKGAGGSHLRHCPSYRRFPAGTGDARMAAVRPKQESTPRAEGLNEQCQQCYHCKHGHPEYPKRVRIDPEAAAASRGA
jgi:hypothetical protein